jgi:hypothetical protein
MGRMFQSEKVGVYLDDLGHRLVKSRKGEGEVAMVDLTFRIQPLTPELAGELEPSVKRTLFRLTDGEPVQHINAMGFKLGIPQQDLYFFTTPETKKIKFHLQRCDISKIVRARADADMPGFVLIFRASYAHPGKDELAYFHDGLYKQHFVSFQQTDPTLGLTDDAPEVDEDQEARELEAQRQAEQDEASVLNDGDGNGGGLEFDEERRRAVQELDPDDQATAGKELTTELEPGVRPRMPLKARAKKTAARKPAKAAKTAARGKAAKRGGKKR